MGLAFHAGEIPLAQEFAKPYTWSIVKFTLWQSALSAIVSVSLAIPLSRALHRRKSFPGRLFLIRLTSVSLVVPTMVAILGIIIIHGRGGWINNAIVLFGGERVDYLYGLNGILIAHVFFNLPLVTRLFLNGLNDIPTQQWRLASQLGLMGRNLFRVVELPIFTAAIPGAFGVVFLLCFTSFAIVLTLGGGPASTTLEVAIYQAVRFDFNLATAVALSVLQILICLFLAGLFFSRQPSLALSASDHADHADSDRPDYFDRKARLIDYLVILVLSLFLFSPFIAMISHTLSGDGWVILANHAFYQALFFTLIIAVLAGLLSTFAGACIALFNAKLRLRGQSNNRSIRIAKNLGALSEIIAMITLLVPPITLGTGLFLLLRVYADLFTIAPLLMIITNALFTLAFTVRVLSAPVFQQLGRFDHLNQSLGISGMNLWKIVLLPVIRKPACYALAISITLAVGDFGVIALFGTEKLFTLPLLIYRLLGAYRFDQAAVCGLLLCGLCLLLFVGLEKLGVRKT